MANFGNLGRYGEWIIYSGEYASPSPEHLFPLSKIDIDNKTKRVWFEYVRSGTTAWSRGMQGSWVQYGDRPLEATVVKFGATQIEADFNIPETNTSGRMYLDLKPGFYLKVFLKLTKPSVRERVTSIPVHCARKQLKPDQPCQIKMVRGGIGLLKIISYGGGTLMVRDVHAGWTTLYAFYGFSAGLSLSFTDIVGEADESDWINVHPRGVPANRWDEFKIDFQQLAGSGQTAQIYDTSSVRVVDFSIKDMGISIDGISIGELASYGLIYDSERPAW